MLTRPERPDPQVVMGYRFASHAELALSLDDYDGVWHADFARFTGDGRPCYAVVSQTRQPLGDWVLIEEDCVVDLRDDILTWQPVFIHLQGYLLDPARRIAYLHFLSMIRERWRDKY